MVSQLCEDVMIEPTVGRVVYFTPATDAPHHSAAPLAALITHVWSDTCVNLAIFDPNGKPFDDPPTSVLLVQPENEKPSGGHYCEWMPYQVKKPTGSESGERAAGTQSI